MIPRDAQGPQATQARGAESGDGHQHYGGGDGRTRHDLQNHPARRDAAGDRPAPPASLPQRGARLSARRFPAASPFPAVSPAASPFPAVSPAVSNFPAASPAVNHRVPSRSVLDSSDRLIRSDLPSPRHRGCGHCTGQSTNRGRLPDIWKLSGKAVAGPRLRPPPGDRHPTSRFLEKEFNSPGPAGVWPRMGMLPPSC